MNRLEIKIPQREELIFHYIQQTESRFLLKSLEGIGDFNFLKSLVRWRKILKNHPDWRTIPIITETDTFSLMIKKLLLQCLGQWHPPFADDELCHCMKVPSDMVQWAIFCGAHTPQQVSRFTGASTQCGTCQPDVQRFIHYLVNNKL